MLVKLQPQTITDVEHMLGYLLSVLRSARDGNRKELDAGAFDFARKVLAAAERPLNKLGIYSATEQVLNESEQLVVAGPLEEAGKFLLGFVREMMEKSGTNDRLRKLYAPETSKRKQ